MNEQTTLEPLETHPPRVIVGGGLPGDFVISVPDDLKPRWGAQRIAGPCEYVRRDLHDRVASDLAAQTARADAMQRSYEDLYADALADAQSDAQEFEGDLWKQLRDYLTELNLDWSDYTEDGITAEQAIEHIRECMDGETARVDAAEEALNAMTHKWGQADRDLTAERDKVARLGENVMLRVGEALAGLSYAEASQEARARIERAITAAIAEVPEVALPDNFDRLVADGISEAMKAMRRFPQPNYVISKIAEEAGEVVKAAIHAAEGRETAENLRGEMKQLIAMLYRLWIEGDQVHGLGSVSAALRGEGQP